MEMTAYYDLGKSPVTHDFINWLARVEQERIKTGAETVKIRFVRGYRQFSFRDYLYTHERRDRRVYELLFALARLLPNVTDVCMVDEGKQTLEYHNFTEPQKPVLRASEIDRSIVSHFLKELPNPVTFTVRQTDFEHARNTNNEEWATVLKWLVDRDYSPIVIPDMESEMAGILNGLEDFIQYPAAAFSPGLRLALYEQSVVNLMTTGGPMVMALFADVPMMAFKLIVPGIQCCTPQHMMDSAMTPDSDWGDRKRLYWANDTAANIIKRLEVELPKLSEKYKPNESPDLFSLNPERLLKKIEEVTA